MADEMRLRTERLVLRRAVIDDLGAMHRVLSDERAMRFWSTPPHSSQKETESWLRSMIDAPQAVSYDFVVELDGMVIGKAGCWRLPEIGFILHPEHWRRGLMREALRAVIESTFSNHPVPEIMADVDPRNIASLQLLRQLGFAQTGSAARTWFVNDVWCDSVYLALPRDAWVG